jgi:hypothetical protein
MDAAERRMTARRPPIGDNVNRDKTSSSVRQESELSSGGKMLPGTFLALTDLLGRVVRNSEFTDATEKLEATYLYLGGCIKALLVFFQMLAELLEDLSVRSSEEEGRKLTPEDLSAIRYILYKAVTLGLGMHISDTFATDKMLGIYEEMLKDSRTNLPERIFIAMILLDLRLPQWEKYWRAIIDAKPRRQFVLDLLTDKIWRLIYTRPLQDGERNKLADITVHIEEIFGRPRHSKSKLIADVRKSAAATAKREG